MGDNPITTSKWVRDSRSIKSALAPHRIGSWTNSPVPTLLVHPQVLTSSETACLRIDGLHFVDSLSDLACTLACLMALWIYGLDGWNYDDFDDLCKWANLQIDYPLPSYSPRPNSKAI